MSVNLGTAYAELKIKTDGFSSGIKQASGQLDEFKNKAGLIADGFTAAGKAMTKAGSALTKSVTAPVIALGTAAVNTTATFDQSMSKVQALSGAVGKDFDDLRDKAIEMGAKTSFSASEAADAFGYMALAGWKTGDMLDGIEGILNLAAASQMDLAQASDLVTDYLSAFGLQAKDSARMANELAYAQANSNMTTEQIGEAFKNSASQMNTAGQSMETTIGILGRLADQGLKGSEAGTALSATIRDITQKMYTIQDATEAAQYAADGFKSVTGDMNDVIGVSTIEIGKMLVPVSDAKGNFRDLTDILADVEKATYGMGSAEKSAALLTTFTARSIKAVSMALNAGTDDIKKFTEEVKGIGDSAYAANTAETMLKNLNGQITILKSTIETLLIQIGDILMPTISKVVERIRQLVVYFTSLDEEQKKQIIRWAAIAAAIGPVLLVIGKLVTSVGTLINTGTKLLTWGNSIAKAFGLISSGAGGITSGLGAIAGAAAPIAAVAAAVVGLGVAFKALYDQNGTFKESVDNLVSTLQNGLKSAIDDVKTSIDNFISMLTPSIDLIKQSFDLSAVDEAMSGLVDAFGQLLDAVQPVVDFIVNGLINVLKAEFVPLISLVMGFINGIVSALPQLINIITSIIDVVTDVFNVVTALIKGIITGDFTNLKQAVNQLWVDIKSVISNAIKFIKTFFSGFFEGFATTFDDFTGGLFTKAVDFLSNLWDNIYVFFTSTIPDAFNKFITVTVPNFINNIETWFDQLPYKIGYAIGQALVRIYQWGTDMQAYIKKQIPVVINNIEEFFKTLPSKIWTWITNTLDKIKTWGEDMKKTASSIAKSFIDNMIDLIKTLPDKIWSWITQIPEKIKGSGDEMEKAGSSIFERLWDGMVSIWNSISDWFTGVFDRVNEFLQGIRDGMNDAWSAAEGSHADGLSYVPYNGYRAMLHEGERVLTKNEAENYNKQGATYYFTFNSPKAIDAYEANKLFRDTVRKLDEGFE